MKKKRKIKKRAFTVLKLTSQTYSRDRRSVETVVNYDTKILKSTTNTKNIHTSP